MPDIRAVLFDYGMVLTGPPDPAAWKQLKQLLSADEEPFHAAYWRHRHDYDRGTLNGETYWSAVANDLGRSLHAETLRPLFDADTALWTQPNEPMIAWAEQLQHVGIRTGLLSNIGDAMEAGVRRCCPWLASFHHLTFSHSLRLAKPEAAIYAHAIAGLGVPANEILFIDDREENIAAARDTGMVAICYTAHDAFVEALRALNVPGLPLPSANARND